MFQPRNYLSNFWGSNNALTLGASNPGRDMILKVCLPALLMTFLLNKKLSNQSELDLQSTGFSMI